MDWAAIAPCLECEEASLSSAMDSDSALVDSWHSRDLRPRPDGLTARDKPRLSGADLRAKGSESR